MDKLILYKYSSDEESKIIEWMLTLRSTPHYQFDELVDTYCKMEYINPDEFDRKQLTTLYMDTMDTLKDVISENSISYLSFNKVYMIISDKTLDLIKDKLKDLDLLSVSIISLNIGCEEISNLPF